MPLLDVGQWNRDSKLTRGRWQGLADESASRRHRAACRPPALQGFGAWNLRDVRFLTGSALNSWAIACFANPRFAEADLCSMQAGGSVAGTCLAAVRCAAQERMLRG